MKASREKPPADDPAGLSKQVREDLDIRAMAVDFIVHAMPASLICWRLAFPAVTDQ